VLSTAALGIVGVAHTQEIGLPVPNSLPDELAAALKKRSPLLVMVSLPGCPFCKIARTNYLLPLQRQSGLAIVQIDMRNRQMVIGLDGVSQTQDQITRNWGVKIAPTVLFFGAGGAEVAERLVGGYIPDFYGYYLDERVRVAKSMVAG
jgi:thioredoxin-related protein